MARIAASAGAGEVRGLWSPRWRTTSVSLLFSIGVVAFDELGVTTALPRVAVELGGLATYGAAVSSTVLATLVGSAVSGHLVDRHGPAAPSAVGHVVFAVGLVVSGTAADWSTFLIGRVIQGLGAGAVVAMVYVVLVRRLPPALRSRALALVSSAWTVPSLAGPSVSGLLTDTLGWRAVFALLLVLAVTAGGVSLLVNRRTRTIGALTDDRPDPPSPGSALAATAWATVLAVSVAGLLAGITGLSGTDRGLPLVDVALVAAGTVAAVAALRRLTPTGTLRARPGLPAGIAARGLLAAAYFGPATFLALLLIELRGIGATLAGVLLSAGSLAWVTGAAVHARADHGRSRTHMRCGYSALALGIGTVAVMLITPAAPVALVGVGWAIAGLGMGLAYTATTRATLDHAHHSNHGSASSALQIAQTLATAGTAGLGTALLAHHPGASAAAVAALFGAALICVVAGERAARRVHH